MEKLCKSIYFYALYVGWGVNQRESVDFYIDNGSLCQIGIITNCTL